MLAIGYDIQYHELLLDSITLNKNDMGNKTRVNVIR